MLPPPRIERLSLPPMPAAPARAAFPLAASVAPVVVSLGIWAVTGSPYSLLFAALGPVVALGSLLDGRRHRRRTVRRDQQRALAAIARVAEQVQAVNSRERDRLDRLAPSIHSDAASRHAVESWTRGAVRGDAAATPLPVRLGRARLEPVVELTGHPDDDAPSALRDSIAGLRRSAEGLDGAPWVIDAGDGVALLGCPAATRSVARSLVAQLLVQCSPASTRLIAPADETWVTELPHRVTRSGQQSYRLISEEREAVIAWGRDTGELPPRLGATIRVVSGPGAASAGDAPGPWPIAYGALTAARAREVAQTLAAVARDHSVVDLSAAIPESVTLADLLAMPSGREPSASRGGDLRAPIGIGADGVVELDLVREGPHAVVAGTTGTGKSELLVSWVLAMASRHPPSDVTFLLIDFKGGAAFAPLAMLPHVVGIVSDLDARRSRRAIESLRSELRRRELLLAERGARSIEEAPGELARLVIVVDEFAAVVSDRPELHEVFSDLAARGRSLGLHLVLCTQRPAGVIRDGVLANVTLRISLRVTDRGDSTAMLGSDAAYALPPMPRGRAVIADGSGTVREVQLALAERADAERLQEAGDARSATSTTAPVWRDPLPEVLRLDELRRDPDWGRASGIVFGRLDLPAEQRQPLAVHDPTADGHLLVLGAARAGRTTALATLAVDARCRVLPNAPADAWSVLDELARRTPGAAADGVAGKIGERTVLVIDDLDVLIDRVDPDARHEFVDLLARVARESRRIGLIVSAQRLTAPLQRLAGLFDSRLLLRQPSRDEHVLAGGDGASFDPRLPPGAGIWRGGSTLAATVQVAIGDRSLPAAELPELPRVRPEPRVTLAVVAGRPREVLGAIRAGATGTPGPRVVRVGEEPVPDAGALRVSRGEPLVLLGDPDAWQAEWALLAGVRRESPLVFTGCTAAEVRALARIRESLPPLGNRPGECWLVDGGEVHRAILEL